MIGNASFNNSTSNLETYTYGVSARWDWNRNASLNIGLENFFDNVPEDFDLSDEITITTGEYTNRTASINYSTAPVGLFIIGMGGQIGSFYGGNLVAGSINP